MIQIRSFAALLRWFYIVALAATAFAQALPQMPRIEGESLAGQKVVLPDATKGKVAVLIFGFTRASKTPTGAWGDKTLSDFGSQSGLEVYQLPVLQDAPRFIRGMIISGMKKGVKENVRDHFVPILQGESELKKLVSYKEPDDAYLLLVDRGGQIVQQRHGPFTDAMYGQLRRDIQSLLGQK